MPQAQTKPVVDSIRELKGFVFDLDGTIWEGPRLLPGAADLVADLRQMGSALSLRQIAPVMVPASCATGSRPSGSCAKDEEVVSAFDLVGAEIRRRLGPLPVLAVGTEELIYVLKTSGHSQVPFESWEQARAVVVGVDPEFSYDRLRAAARAVAAGAAFFAINMDARFPVGPGLFDPGCGSLAEAIATAGGARPVAIGKPEGALFRVAIEKLGCAASHAAMVGDSTASDIKGGRAAGMYTIWINPEKSKDVIDSTLVDLEISELDELHRLWRQARPTDAGGERGAL